jgi:CubicO group peptidase (beta-lactamase class C family)
MARLIRLAAATHAPALSIIVDGRAQMVVSVDPRDGTPIASDCMFNLGSIAKTFTATVLAKLVHDGAVDLGASVRDAVPDEPWLPDVSFASLATHSSGLPREATHSDGVVEPVDSIDALRAAMLASSITAAGRYRYSNLGYLVLGYAIERVAGRALPELVRINLIDPLGMTNTRYANELTTPPTGVRIDNARSVAERASLPGAGGFYGTAGDLNRWARACIRPPESLREVIASTTRRRFALGRFTAVPESWMTPARVNTRHIGLAWRVEAGGLVWHTGGTNGFTSWCAANDATGTTVVALLAAGIGELSSSPRAVPSVVRLFRLRNELRRLSIR